MPNTIKTVLHYYYFDISKPEDAAAYKALCAGALAEIPFKTWTMDCRGAYQFTKPASDFIAKVRDSAGPIELETDYLFDNQWNSAPTSASNSGMRLFNKAQMIYENKKIKEGYYLDQTAEMAEVLRNTYKCGYCGKQEPAAKGYVFCPHCLDSEYLKESDLHLTRMVSVCDTNKPRAPLTEAEKVHLLPLYRDAQINGSTARGKARIAKKRADVQREYQQTIAHAAEKRDAATWIMNNAPGLLENWIYYTHTGRHCFGWRKPLDECLLSDLLDKVSEFPFSYDIKCADGRTLSGEH